MLCNRNQIIDLHVVPWYKSHPFACFNGCLIEYGTISIPKMIMTALCWYNTVSLIFIYKLNNNPQVDLSFHSDTLS
jgi:hypothetical protein